MPRINDFFADSAVYFYESEADANEGNRSGGSGFLTHVVSSASPTVGHVYAVTNKHIVDNGCVVIRINRKRGGFDTLPTQLASWVVHPNGDDVAVLPIDMSDETFSQFTWWSIDTRHFITRDIIKTYNVGLGDEVFMVGRLMSHEGRQRNAPVVRFGNISLMADPYEPIRVETLDGQSRDQEGFLVECRSLSGFSGSPVFVFTDQLYKGEDALRVQAAENEKRNYKRSQGEGLKDTPVFMEGRWGPWFLGIDWGHIPLYREIEENRKKRPDLKVELNTGIACVLPAWKILELLEVEELVKQRSEEDRKIAKRLAHESAAVNDIAVKESDPFTKQDFEDALKKASRKLSDET
jgi:hypothetical protein